MEVIIDNNHLKVAGDWLKIWKLKVPNRVKIFIWRTLRGCLPVRERLIQKGVRCEQSCPCCASNFENEWHCFIGCEAAQEVWKEARVWQTMEPYVHSAQGYVELIFTLLQKLDNDKMNRVVMLLWSIWWRRNQKCWNDVLPAAFEVNRRARGALDDWTHVRRQPAHISHNANNIMQQNWTKPQQGILKCNVDAACYVAENRYSIGACIRDDRGKFIKAMSAQFVGQPAVHEAEAQGLLITLNWLKQMQISSKIEIEMDCLQVVQNIAGKSNNLTEFGILIGKCKTSLNLIYNCKVSFIRRQANRVAHELAQVARYYASPHVFEYCPPCIEIIVMNEMH